jgi:DNA-binding CsgD family transcriptional regulator
MAAAPAIEHSPQQRQARSLGRVRFSDAMRAWFAGDFEGCLGLCDRVRATDRDTISQLALLRARALLRIATYRPAAAAEAEAALRSSFIDHGILDASLTAQMLFASARIRQDDRRGALAALDVAAGAAERAHCAVRSEIAFHRALAHYGDRNLHLAEARLRDVDPGSDIIFARALELRGWIEGARGRYADAARFFRRALSHLEGCRQSDRFLSANCLHALGIFAVEMMDRDGWNFVMERAARMSWDASGLALPRFWLKYLEASMCEVLGDAFRAGWCAREAEVIAPTPAFALVARCRRAQICRDRGETLTQYEHVLVAQDMYARLDLNALAGEEALAPIQIARELAHIGDASGARDAYAAFAVRANRVSRMLGAVEDVRLRGIESMLEGAMFEAEGSLDAAIFAYNSAFHIFSGLGYTRRAVDAALRLADLTGEPEFRSYIERATADAAESFWPRRTLRRKSEICVDPVFADLTPTERDTLRGLYDGKSYAAIARERGRSLNTVRNTIHRIYGKFGVSGRGQTVRECRDRRIFGAESSAKH